MERWRAVVQRFQEWKQSLGLPLDISYGWPGPAFNFDIREYTALEDWLGERYTVLTLGGLEKRPRDEMRAWLLERKARGLERIHSVLVGTGEVHDRWAGRRGDFDFILDSFRAALDIDLKYSVTLYLTRSSLPLLGELGRVLDSLPQPPEYRHYRQFYYGGYAAHYDGERISEAELLALPAPILESFRESFDSRTERAWARVILGEPPRPFDIHLDAELTRDNIEEFESRACGDLFEDMAARARAGVRKLPDWHELAHGYADAFNDRAYGRFEIARLWVDRFLQQHDVEFDARLLHEHVGTFGSRQPPRLL